MPEDAMTATAAEPISGDREKPKRDFRKEVTENMIEMLEKGVAPWQKPWEPGVFQLPVNPTTDRNYRGGNAVHLMAMQSKRGYEDPRWMTYRQAQENGWQVRQGEKGTQIEFWQFQGSKGKEGDGKNEPEMGKGDSRGPLHRVYTVFNGKQIEGIPALEPRQPQEWEIVQAGESILTNSGASVKYDQADRAYYSHSSDEIHLPPKDAFRDAPRFYGTALHELGHWSGHGSRLNRDTLVKSGGFGTESYAKEELRAELTSLFLAAERGIPHDPSQHAAYVGSWIQALKNDKNEIFRAAKDAHNAADFILSLEQAKELEGPTVEAESGATEGRELTPARTDEEKNQSALREGKEPSGPRRETSEWVAEFEKGTGTVDLTEKETATEHRVVTLSGPAKDADGRGVVALTEEQIEDDRVMSDRTPGYGTIEESFAAATEVAKTRLGEEARTIPAQLDSGTYQGEIIGQTDQHVVMRLSNSMAVAHPKDLLGASGLLSEGSTLRINYTNQVAALVPAPVKEKSLGLGL